MCAALSAKVDRVLVLLAGEESGGFARGAVPRAVAPERDGVVVLNDDVALVVGACGRGVLVGGRLGQGRVVGDGREVGFEEVDIGEVGVFRVGTAETDHDLKD